MDGYKKLFSDHGFINIDYEDQSYTLKELIRKGERMLSSIDVMERMFKFKLENLLGLSKDEAGDLLKITSDEVEKGNIGYGMFLGEK